MTMATRPHIAVQVIPFGQGAFAVMSGALILLSFPETDEPDSAYVESVLGLDTVEDEASVAALSAVWADSAVACPSPERSRAIIEAARDM
jgi:hypothetical protein